MFVLMRLPAAGIGLWLAAGDVIKTVSSRICSFSALSQQWIELV